MLEVKLYDPKVPGREAPHEPVLETLRSSESGPSAEMVEAHRQRVVAGKAEPYIFWTCACCDWGRGDVRKIRAKKKKALDRFLRTGKLPPLRSTDVVRLARTPKPLSDEEAGRVVLPKLAPGTGKLVLTRDALAIEGDPVERYREAMGGGKVDPRAVDWGAYWEWTGE